VDYLLNVNRGYRMDLGKRVVVVGGGFVAFDAARTARRQGEAGLDVTEPGDTRPNEVLDSARAAMRGGATEVTIVSLESFDEMPVLRSAQGQDEFAHTREEGIAFLTRRGPKAFVGDGRLTAVDLRAVRTVFDTSGRFAPEYDDADVVRLAADACILAIGQQPALSFLKPEDGIELTPAGTIRIDRETLATSAAGIFAGGDVAFGPRNLIEAVANGKRAARSIHAHLSHDQAATVRTLEIETIPTPQYRMQAGFELLDREPVPTLDVGRRTGIAEVETGFDDAAARRQAARCLVCHVQTIYDPERCVLCSRCVDVCPEYCLTIVPFEDLDLPAEERKALEARAEGSGLPLSAMIKDDERCIRCGLCAVRCPTDAMTMERFTITERFVAEADPAAAAVEERP
jgi:formate dehydrogenase beta subunit